MITVKNITITIDELTMENGAHFLDAVANEIKEKSTVIKVKGPVRQEKTEQ